VKECNVINLLTNQIWAMLPERLMAMADIIAAGISVKSQKPTTSLTQQNIAYLPLWGVVDQHSSWMLELFGGTSTEDFGRMFDMAMADSSIGAVLIDVDSPGGSVYGVQELSDKIYNARGKKPIIACVNSMMASAAYWIGSAADEIIITPSGEAGSIGVIAMHFDYSEAESKVGIKPTIITAGKYKGEGNPHEPLSSDAKDNFQERIDDYYNAFVGAVARNRGVSAGKVLSDFGQGRMLGAKQAKSVGLVDNIGTIDNVVRSLSVRKTTMKAAAHEAQLNLKALEMAKVK
jgi:signal peptide peptidase SppA